MALIEVEQLKKYYKMGGTIVRALDGVDLTIERGEFVAITGSSGSGKSTLMHLLGCLDRPTAGAYRLDGSLVSSLSDGQLAAVRNRKIGFVFQSFNLINRIPAVDNVCVPMFYARRTGTRGTGMRALERVGLGPRAGHKPNELSGGERQRVAIARSIVNDPVLILADEPTGNLDTRTGEQIMGVFHDLNAQGVTIILVTHEPDIARQARRIIHMRDGRILSDGPAVDSDWAAPAPRSAAPVSFSGGNEGGVAVEARAPAVASQPAAQVEVAADVLTAEDFGPPTRLPGSSKALWISGIATTLVAASIVAGKVLQQLYPFKPGVGAKPPPELMTGGLIITMAVLAGMILGILGMVSGRGALLRQRREPGNWLGAGKARIGFWLGLLALTGPFLNAGVSIALKLMSRGGEA